MFFVLWWDTQPMAAHPTTIQIESIHGIPRDNPPAHIFPQKVSGETYALSPTCF